MVTVNVNLLLLRLVLMLYVLWMLQGGDGGRNCGDIHVFLTPNERFKLVSHSKNVILNTLFILYILTLRRSCCFKISLI